ncbi:MAG: hypothetical protein OEW58_08090 [Gammaproteobacteria bacterium]|nr:hypothetical protein [Gammaproteobacteria bacterium]
MNFQILRNMEGFTRDMFNRIIGFQEKEHAAWDKTADFAERIKGLPLHYLVFSNADRDPETHGPTVAHYYPLRKEMLAIAHYAAQVADKPVVVDAHGRNGFIGSLLARELPQGQVVGLRDPKEKPNQIENFMDENCYRQQPGTLAGYDGPADVVFSSWMPSCSDISDDINRLKPKLVVYVYTEHTHPETAEPQTGLGSSFGDRLSADYQLIDEWQVIRSQDMFHEVWPDLTGNIEEVRLVRIYSNQPLEQLPLPSPTEVYDWEEELLMAETALTAKREMMRSGFPAFA